jgi:hypothetical protein
VQLLHQDWAHIIPYSPTGKHGALCNFEGSTLERVIFPLAVLRSDHIHVSHEIGGDSLFECIQVITAPGNLHEFDERAYVQTPLKLFGSHDGSNAAVSDDLVDAVAGLWRQLREYQRLFLTLSRPEGCEHHFD